MNEAGSARRESYLLLLARPSIAARSEAARALRTAGISVAVQYGGVAIEVRASLDEARAAEGLGLFSAALRGAMKEEHLERLTAEQREVVEAWNTRFTEAYRRGKAESDSLRGRSWGEGGDLAPPAPYSAIDPEDFRELVAEYERRTGRRAGGSEGAAGQSGGPVAEADLAALEEALRAKHGDPTVAYHLARLAQRLGPAGPKLVESLDEKFVEELTRRFFSAAACQRMTGEIAVGIVFVESARAEGPTFGGAERHEVFQEILDGLRWLSSEHPSGNLSWSIDVQPVRIDVEDGDDSEANCGEKPSDALEPSWRDPAMAEVSYQGNIYPAALSSVASYREDMRVANGAEHAIVIFATPFANCWHAYAVGGGRLVLARHNDWGGWGRHTLDMTTAHEVGHLFGASDEYTGSGTPCRVCDSLHGCDQIPNGNCGACARPHQDCVMHAKVRRLCPWTRAHIGWSHLFVELTTADARWASTNDEVELDIGDRAFVLDTADHDDRERNNRDGYAIWVPELDCADVRRVMIRKGPDGFAGGWKLGGVRVWCGGQLVCDRGDIDRWLEDDERVWAGCETESTLVNRLQVRVTTADASWAGTDDDVTITMAGREWNLDNPGHNDFERGHTDTFELDPGTALHLSDLTAARVHKSRDGFAGGWKLKGVEVLANDVSIFNDQGIDRWLEDDKRTWQGFF